MEERQEAAINGRRSQNSERVRAHLYEREFRGKPVSREDCAHERGCARRSNHAAHSTGSRTRAVPPDEHDMHLGRERPPQTEAWGDDRGVAEGVAHAPDASATVADSRADRNAGGTRRRPIQYCELAQGEGHRQINLPGNDVDPAARSTASRARERGNAAPASAFPPPFLRFHGFARVQRKETRIRSGINGPLPTALARRLNRLTLPVQPSSKTLLHDLPAVAGIRVGFQVAQAFRDHLSVPLWDRKRLRNRRDSIPQQLQIFDLLVDRQLIEPRWWERHWHRHQPGSLESRVNRLALQGEDPEHALVNASERFSLNEALESFDPQRELSKGKGSLT